MRIGACVAAAAMATAAAAAAGSAQPARAEIDALLKRVDASACEFNRNGTWYPAAAASSHLSRKLGYLELRGSVQSAEQFIDVAASTSSLSGRPYLVRCGNDSPVESAAWLRAQLQLLRSGRAAK